MQCSACSVATSTFPSPTSTSFNISPTLIQAGGFHIFNSFNRHQSDQLLNRKISEVLAEFHEIEKLPQTQLYNLLIVSTPDVELPSFVVKFK
jgi:hypothetical protein